MIQFTKELKHHLDFITQGVGCRYYASGKLYQGSFQHNKRDGYGTLYNTAIPIPEKEGGGYKVEYEGYWKVDKRDGKYGMCYYDNGNTYKGILQRLIFFFIKKSDMILGEWKHDLYHGRGLFRPPIHHMMGIGIQEEEKEMVS